MHLAAICASPREVHLSGTMGNKLRMKERGPLPGPPFHNRNTTYKYIYHETVYDLFACGAGKPGFL
jgi:hypothetical protein